MTDDDAKDTDAAPEAADDGTANGQNGPAYINFADFLESIAPGKSIPISDLAHKRSTQYRVYDVLHTPLLKLHCATEECDGIRFFRCTETSDIELKSKDYTFKYVRYVCSNCQKYSKVYSLALKLERKGGQKGYAYKFGELPPFGPPTPPRLIKLIGPDKDEFLSGRRCESQGLGVGAFSYYRRVVENQKTRIFQEIRKVAEKGGASPETLQKLDSAIEETQFSKAIDIAKSAMPDSLKMDGKNPLSLLHSALSEGLHNKSDEECLVIASSVRIILGELSERLAQLLKDEAELRQAIGHLLDNKQ